MSEPITTAEARTRRSAYRKARRGLAQEKRLMARRARRYAASIQREMP
jgi:hypothetical protein